MDESGYRICEYEILWSFLKILISGPHNSLLTAEWGRGDLFIYWTEYFYQKAKFKVTI